MEIYTNVVPYFNEMMEKVIHISNLVTRNLVMFVRNIIAK